MKSRLRNTAQSWAHVHVDVWARPRYDTEDAKVAVADFVFLALHNQGEPREILEN
jgi:acyl-CoA thioesterase YciA